MEAVTTIPHKKIELDGTDLYVVDDQVQRKIIENFCNNALSLSYTKKSIACAGHEYSIFHVDFDPEAFESRTILGGTARTLLNTLMQAEPYKLSQVSVNMYQYGDMAWPHRDCDGSGTDITLLYFINTSWKHAWGGELLFYEQQDTRFAVLPAAGRFILFSGAVEHLDSIPSRICTTPKLTLTMKYKEPKQI